MLRLRRTRNLGWVLGITIGCIVTLTAQAPTSPLSGTWKLNLAKSKYSPADLAPKSGTIKYDATADGLKGTTDVVDSQGRKVHAEYTVKFDGKAGAWKGTLDGKPNPDQDGVTWKKIDNYTYETTTTLKGKALTTTHIVVARDGKSRTGTATGKNAQGKMVKNTVVYDKQ